eukprot:543262-Prymnesium_polylepis.1
MHCGLVPPRDARDEEVGEKDARRGERRQCWLQVRRRHVVAQPRTERLHGLLVRLVGLQAERIVSGQRAPEH